MSALRLCSILAILSAATRVIGQDISQVRFTYHESLGEPPQEIMVVVGKDADSASAYVFSQPALRDLQRYFEPDTIVPISLGTFQEIVQAVVAIRLEDLRHGMGISGEDGSTWTLEFGHGSNTITYQLWTPSFNAEQRHLGPFIHACELIQKHARLDHLVFD